MILLPSHPKNGTLAEESVSQLDSAELEFVFRLPQSLRDGNIVESEVYHLRSPRQRRC